MNTNITNNTFVTLAEGEGEAIRFTTTDNEAVVFNALNGNGTAIKDILGEDRSLDMAVFDINRLKAFGGGSFEGSFSINE